VKNGYNGRGILLSLWTTSRDKHPETMLNYFWVAAGGALGTVARFWFSGLVERKMGVNFPWGTLFVNVSGSLVIGFFATYFGPDSRFPASLEARQFVMVGILGGYTTFSSFSLQTLTLVREGNWVAAGGNAVASFVLCMVAVTLGHLAATSLGSSRAP
jgi:fluoride exporter